MKYHHGVFRAFEFDSEVNEVREGYLIYRPERDGRVGEFTFHDSLERASRFHAREVVRKKGKLCDSVTNNLEGNSILNCRTRAGTRTFFIEYLDEDEKMEFHVSLANYLSNGYIRELE